ncbi:FAD-dependent oxidoreductase [Iodidimonas sp. SYSU 1G8]|uniref:FAD-dependent oxidoreductase n=1 Tax=Iodidimonas sp. SYSU 1G8 TaxID=3133967 RepID=UPI0031FE98B8
MARDYDVIVVGSGAAGLAAAVAASDAGASVLVVESEKKVGGSSRLSGGHFYAAGTSVQRAAGVNGDTADAMFEHYMTLAQWLVDPAVVRRYCDLSAPTLEWMLGLGVKYPKEGLYASGVGSVPRGHPPEGDGEEVINVLDGHRSNKGIDVVLNSRVTALVTNDEGRVTGVRIGDDEATCGAVIMATGGFGNNPEMIQKYLPQAAAGGDWNWYIGADGARGDGLTLGQAVGGVIDGHDRALILATPGFSRDLEVALPGWLVMVNKDGRRFCDETVNYTVMAGLLNKQGGSAYAIFDEDSRAAAKRSPQFQAYWVNDVLQQKAEDGRIFRADTLAKLAAKAGIDPEGLEGMAERYNADVDAGQDTAFFKKAKMAPIRKGPFYAVEIRPAILCWTGTGLRINADTCVMNKADKPIRGLYAAGETVGNLHGDRYIGGGGSYGPCLVFGKLAGENAAKYAKELNE